jgi:predicted ATPase
LATEDFDGGGTVRIDREISFGPFRLRAAQQLLLKADQPVQIGARALDILIALSERAGELVTKDELTALAWPNLVVDEGNLRTQMALLRRALQDGQDGARYVATVPGRGYRFVAPVSETGQPNSGETRSLPPEPPGRLPVRLTELVGRDDVVGEIIRRLQRRRFVTIVGPGGIGKTTVAIAVADKLSDTYPGGACFVDLASILDPALVAIKLGSTVGLGTASHDPIGGVVAFLRDREMLVVLDCCEHVAEAAAVLAERLLKGAPGIRVLATSREPLLAEGEVVNRLPPLETPPERESLTAATAISFPAVKLFVERAASNFSGFELGDADAPIVADICRRLDGIALAIELAAGRVDAFGIRGVAERLDDRFRLLMRGRRTAAPRHQTLTAVLDWSYTLLSEPERTILNRLAIFVGGFTLDAACAVAADGDITASDVTEIVASLVSKSLVAAYMQTSSGTYRLLDTTRAYAAVKSTERGEFGEMARRHAEYYRTRFDSDEHEPTGLPSSDWLAVGVSQIDNIHAALNWAFSPDGDPAVGVALTVAVVPLWMHLSLYEGCRQHVELALASRGASDSRTPRQEMQLFAALGATLVYSKGPGVDAETAWTNALAIAERLEDTDYQMRALWGLWSDRFNNGELQRALETSDRFRTVAAKSDDQAAALMGDRLIGLSLFYLGDQGGARRHIEHVLKRRPESASRLDILRFRFDQRVAARSLLAMILWNQGLPDQAMSEAAATIEEAQASDHAMSLALALERACRVATLSGDFAYAERLIAMLLDHSARHSLDLWDVRGACLNGMLLIASGRAVTGLPILRDGLAKFPEDAFHLRYIAWEARLAEALGLVGEVSGGLAIIDDVIARAQSREVKCYLTEALCIKGELLRLGKPQVDVVSAEENLEQALALARRQEVLSLELRGVLGLARLWRDQGRLAHARDLLASVYGRFTEGFGTADLRTAKSLLDEWS